MTRSCDEAWLVTGASRGIGRAIAESLLRRGERVVLVGRDSESLSLVAEPFAASAFVVAADLTDRLAVDRLVGRAIDRAGRLSGLVNCAGVSERAPWSDVSRELLAAQLEVNFVTPFLLARDVATHLRDEGRSGSILQVASTLALHPAAETSAYAASKAALVSATRSLALELAVHSIRVNALAPGLVDTAMLDGRDRGALGSLAPLARLGTPREIADAALYLLDAEWVTGTVLTIDGGLLLR